MASVPRGTPSAWDREDRPGLRVPAGSWCVRFTDPVESERRDAMAAVGSNIALGRLLTHPIARSGKGHRGGVPVGGEVRPRAQRHHSAFTATPGRRHATSTGETVPRGTGTFSRRGVLRAGHDLVRRHPCPASGAARSLKWRVLSRTGQSRVSRSGRSQAPCSARNRSALESPVATVPRYRRSASGPVRSPRSRISSRTPRSRVGGLSGNHDAVSQVEPASSQDGGLPRAGACGSASASCFRLSAGWRVQSQTGRPRRGIT